MSLAAYNSDVMVAFVDPQSTIRYANPAWIGFFKSDFCVGAKILDLFKTGTIESEVSLALGGTALNFEYPVPDSAGNEKLLSVSFVPQQKEAGKAAGFYVVAKDISAQSKDSRRLRLTIGAVGVGTWEWDIRTGEVRWDDNQYKLYGIKRSDFKNDYQAWESTLHPEDKERLLPIIDQAINHGQSYDAKFRVIASDGSIRHIRSSAHIDRNEAGVAVCMLGVNWDVTSEFLAEERLRLALSSTKMGVWDWNIAADILTWDNSMYALYGLNPSDFDEEYSAWESAVHPEDKSSARQAIQDAVGNKKPFDTEFRIVYPSGEVRHICAKATTIFDDQGRAVRMTGVNWDITKQKNAELEVDYQRALLLNSERMASLGEMAGGVAHEINSPLAIIVGKVELILDRMESEEFDQQRTRADLLKIKQTAERIATVVRGLRTFSRNADQDPMSEVTISIVVEETLALCTERFAAHGIKLTADISTNSQIECRAAQISQVLTNLLSNAFDAVVDLENKWVRVVVSKVAQSVHISVTDSGFGIPSGLREKIMQPFFTTKEVGKGTGLGLSISLGIVQAHQGTLELNSKSDHTQFVLQLPLRQSK